MTKTKTLRISLSLALALLLLAGSVFAILRFAIPEADAAGTDFSGYTAISTKEQLNAIRNDPDGKYYLASRILFTASDFAEGGAFYNDGAGWLPIGTQDAPFTGTFDANGNFIKGLVCTPPAAEGTVYAGLFGYSTGTVKNLQMTDETVQVSLNMAGYLASIVAYNDCGTVENCSHTGKITSYSTNNTVVVGGIVAYNDYGTVRRCTNHGKFVNKKSTDIYPGAIVGKNDHGLIEGCENASIQNSGSETSVVLSGITSENTVGGTVRACRNTGNAYCGICYFNSGTIEDCYQAGSAYSGIVSTNQATGVLKNCYNVSQSTAFAFSERNSGKVQNCYYVYSSSGTSGTKCTLEQMKSAETFVGFDFEKVWTMEGDAEYPYPELRIFCESAPEEGGEETPAEKPVPGDMDGDKKVTISDLTLLAKYLAGWDVELV